MFLIKNFPKIIIFFLSIFFSCSSNLVAEVSGLITEKDVTGTGNGPTESSVNGMAFNPDGTKMYYVGFAGKVYEFALSSPFSLSSATYSSGEDCNFTTAVQVKPQDVTFNSDGTAMFVTGTNPNDINKFSLSVPYDISTCDIDGRSTHVVGGDPRGISFSNDGTKIFIYNGSGNGGDDSVDQYSLQSPFNLSGMILKKSYNGPDGKTLRSIEKFPQGIAFSFDGTKMFLTGSHKFKVNEFNLSTAYDLSDVTHMGGYEVSNHSGGLKGIAFSSDGSKIFLTDFNSGDHISEYSLTCSYGVINCPDPTANKDVVGLVEAQSEGAKGIIQSTTVPVLDRMKYLRRKNSKTMLSNQNIKFKFSNHILNSLSNSLSLASTSQNNSKSINNDKSNWSYWSEGVISFGRVGNKLKSSSKDISTSGLTFGADRMHSDNLISGIAVRFGKDDIDVGNIGSGIDTKALSLTYYKTKQRADNKFTDSLIGLSLIKSDITKKATSTSVTTGKRNGKQFYGSFNLRDKYSNYYFNFTPKIELKYGVTHFSEYTEKGVQELRLKYNDQVIGHLISLVGVSLDNAYILENGTFSPYLDLELSTDVSPSTKQKISYAVGNGSFTIDHINSTTQTIHGGIGFDLIMNDGLTLITKYKRDQELGDEGLGSGHFDSFIVGLDYNSPRSSSYSMSLENNQAYLSLGKKYSLFKIDLDGNYDLWSENPQYELFLKFSNIN